MYKKQVIHLTESQFRNTVKESVRAVLKENFGDDIKDFWKHTAIHQQHQTNKQERQGKKESKTMKFVSFKWLRKEGMDSYSGNAVFEITTKGGEKQLVSNEFIGKIGWRFSFKHLQAPAYSTAMTKILEQVLTKYENDDTGVIVPFNNEKLNEKSNVIKESVKHIIKEQVLQNNESPAVYVGTYGKYNNGSLKGEWIDLEDFDSKQEFLDYCRTQLHADEPDSELMFQDWEYIPDGFISESWISDKLWEFIKLDEEYPIKYAIANHFGDAETAMSVIESGDYSVHWDCDSVEDVVYEYFDELGAEAFSNLEYYFDYERFGRECSWDGPFDDSNESIYQEFGVDEDDDEALGEQIIEQMYGDIEHAPKETVQQYVDTRKLANAIENEGTFIEADCNGKSIIIQIY